MKSTNTHLKVKRLSSYVDPFLINCLINDIYTECVVMDDKLTIAQAELSEPRPLSFELVEPLEAGTKIRCELDNKEVVFSLMEEPEQAGITLSEEEEQQLASVERNLKKGSKRKTC